MLWKNTRKNKYYLILASQCVLNTVEHIELKCYKTSPNLNEINHFEENLGVIPICKGKILITYK